MSPGALREGVHIVVDGPLPGGERIGQQAAVVVARWVDDQGRDRTRIRMDVDGFEVEYATALLAGSAETVSTAAAEVITTKLRVLR